MSVVCSVPKTPKNLIGNLIFVATSVGKNYLGRNLSVLNGEEQKGQGVFKNVFARLMGTGGALLSHYTEDVKSQVKILAQIAEGQLNSAPIAATLDERPAKRQKVSWEEIKYNDLHNIFLENTFIGQVEKLADLFLLSYYGVYQKDFNINSDQTLQATIVCDPAIDKLELKTAEGKKFVKEQCGFLTCLEASEEEKKRRYFSSHTMTALIEQYPNGNDEVKKTIRTIMPKLVTVGIHRDISDISLLVFKLGEVVGRNLEDTHPCLNAAREVVEELLEHMVTEEKIHQGGISEYTERDLEFYRKMKAVAVAYREAVFRKNSLL